MKYQNGGLMNRCNLTRHIYMCRTVRVAHLIVRKP